MRQWIVVVCRRCGRLPFKIVTDSQAHMAPFNQPINESAMSQALISWLTHSLTHIWKIATQPIFFFILQNLIMNSSDDRHRRMALPLRVDGGPYNLAVNSSLLCVKQQLIGRCTSGFIAHNLNSARAYYRSILNCSFIAIAKQQNQIQNRHKDRERERERKLPINLDSMGPVGSAMCNSLYSFIRYIYPEFAQEECACVSGMNK